MRVLFLSRVPYEVFEEYIKEKFNLYLEEYFVFADVRFKEGYENTIKNNIKFFENYLENNQVLTESSKIVKKFNLNHVIVIDEADMERGAMIRELNNIKGQTTKSASNYRDKSIMKEILKNEILLMNYKRPENINQIKEFINTYGYPIVIKPLSSWATNNTFKIENSTELNNFNIRFKKTKDFLIEKWNDSKMYALEGIQKNGKLIFFVVHEYDKNCLEAVKSNSGFTTLTSSVMNDDRLLSIIKVKVENILNLLNQSDKFISPIHLEFFLNGNDLIFNEVGSRIGGGRTIQLIQEAYNIDFVEVLYKMYSNTKEEHKDLLNVRPKKFIGACRKFKIKNPRNFEDFIRRSFVKKVVYKPKSVDHTNNINQFEAMFLIESASYQELLNIIKLTEEF